MAKVLGKDCKAYYSATELDGASNTPANVSWNEITNLRDLTLNREVGEADVSTRASGERLTLPTLKDSSIEFEMMWDTSDAAFTAMQDAYENGTALTFAAMDGDIESAGSEGLAANWNVMNFSRSEPLEEGVTVSVTLKPRSQIEWYTVSGS